MPDCVSEATRSRNRRRRARRHAEESGERGTVTARTGPGPPTGSLFLRYRAWVYLCGLRLLCMTREEDLLASSFTPLGGLLHILAMGCAGEIGGRRVSGWFHHWVIVDFYDPVWPNIAASILCAVWAVRRIKIHLKRHHQLMLRHFAFLHEKSDDFNSGTAIRVGAINGSNTSGGDRERPGTHERT